MIIHSPFMRGTLITVAFFASFLLHTAVRADSTVLRPGDILEIVMPGEVAFAEPIQIDAEGDLSLPEVGRINIAGQELGAAQQLIAQSLAVVYRDISRLEVHLVERRLMVDVLGFVETPGRVDLADASSVQAALVAAGGLSQGAQLDRLQLRRGNETLVFDYKAYLDSGDPSLLPELQPMDEIFVPSSPLTGNVQVEFDAQTLTSAGDAGEDASAIKVFGEVQQPGTFSFRDEQSVVDLLMRAGGVTRYAGIEKIRVMNGDEPLLFDLKAFLDTGNPDLAPALRPGSTIFVPIQVEEVKSGGNTVYVMGEVASPGAYDMTEGASFFDVLANSGGPNRYADARQIRIIRADGSIVDFDLIGYTEGLSGVSAPAIGPGDAIFVPEKADQDDPSWLTVTPDRAVQVMGAIVRPGRYEWSDEMNLIDLLAHAGGPGPDADVAHVQILAAVGGNAVPIEFDLGDFLQNGGRLNDLPQISAGYTITIPELPRDPSDNKSQWVLQDPDYSIYIMGAVGSPGRFAFNDTLSFLDIIAAADGPTSTADIRNIRVSHRETTDARVSRVDMALYFETGDESLLPDVQPGDVIYVPDVNREWTQIESEQTVRVLGAVGSPGRYTFDDGMTILDLLAEAGGPTGLAWQEQIVVVNLTDAGPEASSFDLIDFAQTGNFMDLPVVRVGDTIYVPTTEQSDWAIFMNGVRDVAQIVSVLALVAAL